MLRIERLREHLKQSLWFVPSLLLLGFVAFAVAAAYVDQNVLAAREDLSLYGGSAEGAHTIFATIATAMLSLAVLVFSITLIVLQLASTQLTPRVLPLFLQNRWSKIAMGVFLGTFAYALVGLWVVRIPSNGDGGLVPVLTVSLAFVAVALSLVTFLNYIHRVAQSIRLETISAAIARQTRAALASTPVLESDSGGAGSATEPARVRSTLEGRPSRAVCAPESGIVAGVSVEVCMRWARENDVLIELLHPVGTFVVEGAPLVLIHGDDADTKFPLSEAVSLARERVIALDPAYGVQELVDIAVRALSAGVNEPGMAVVVLDHIHEILEMRGRSSTSGSVCTDDDGTPRFIAPQLTWEGWVSLALREIVDYGRDSVQVCQRVTLMLEDLIASLPVTRHDPLIRYLREVQEYPASTRPYLEWTAR